MCNSCLLAMKLGEKGEQLARQFLQDQGLRILETNWRHRRAEVDIIAMEGQVMVFVEVKTRSRTRYGPPERFVTLQKEKLLARAAGAYMEQKAHHWEIRFDVIAITWDNDQDYRLEHLRDAFWPGVW